MSETDRLGRVAAAIAEPAGARAWLTVVTTLALAAAGLVYALGNLGINTDTADMISPELQWRQDFIAFRDGFPERDRNVVAVIDAPTAEQSRAFAADLVAALGDAPALFPSVFHAGSGDFFERNGFLYLPTTELEALADRLIGAQPLLGQLAADPTAAGLFDLLARSLASDDVVTGPPTDDLDRIYAELAATLEAALTGTTRPVAWDALMAPETAPSTRQLVLIRPTIDFSLVRPARAAIERIREIGAEVAERHGPDIEMRLTGTLVMEHEELTSITQSASIAGLAALGLVVIVLLWALRSIALLLVAVVVLGAGLCLTAAFAALTVGHLNLLSVAFAVLYIGLGVDFILHFTLRLQELRATGVETAAALAATARGVGGSLVICAVTTAAGFFAFTPTAFDGVSELGWISGGGMLISLLVSLTLLPALLRLALRRPAAGPAAAGAPARGGFVPPRPPPALVLTVAGGLFVVACLLLPRLQFDGNPIHLRDPAAESIRTLDELATDGEAPLFNLIIVAPDSAEAEAVARELAALPTVANVRTAGSLVPADQDDKLFVIDDLSLVLGPTLARFESRDSDPAPAAGRLADSLRALVAAVAAVPSPSRSQAGFLRAARDWLEQLATLPAAAAERSAGELDAAVIGNLVGQVARLERGLAAQRFDRDDLPGVLADRWIGAGTTEIVEVVPRDNLNDNAVAARFVRDVRSVAPRATGLPVVYEEAAATITRAFLQALGYAFVIVALLLLVFLRSVRDAVLVLLPIVFAAVMTAAGSVVLGLPFNFANIIALPLLVGVGVDAGIHMVHRMRTEPRDGSALGTSTSRAVLMSALTTVASFGNLAFSAHLGMASMGRLLTLGMVISVAAILVLLPALIRLWVRR